MKKLLLLILISEACVLAAGNVLIIHPFYGGSHLLTLRRLADSLTERNHKVTIIRWLDNNSYPPIVNPNVTERILSVNNTDGLVPFVTQEGRGRFITPVKRMWQKGLKLTLFPMEGYSTVSTYCKELFESDGLFYQLKNEDYKIAIVDLLFNECGLAFSHKLGLPIVGFWGFNFAAGPALYTPAFNPPSALPQALSSYKDTMGFFERVWNTFYCFAFYALMQVQFLITSISIRKYCPDCPHPSEILANISGMLINSHPAVDFPRLLPPSYLEIAGMHIRKPKPLPQNILDFINSSGEDGVILFSMGFNFDSKYVPTKVFEGYFKAFGRLKQKVIVKAKGIPSYLPSNVKIYPFFPQADILAHNKTVLFVSHCGMHGVMEAVHSAVPIVGIPIYLDQRDNMMRLIDLGVSKGLEKEATSGEIYEAITEVLGDPSYKKNMEALSKRVKSFDDPLQKSIWLLEHIMETSGAPHLKLSSRHLGLFQYLCLDVLLFILVMLFAFVYVVFRVITKVRKTFYDFDLKLKNKLE